MNDRLFNEIIRSCTSKENIQEVSLYLCKLQHIENINIINFLK